MRNVLLLTCILLTQNILGQKYYDVTAYIPDTVIIKPQTCIFDKASSSVITTYISRYYRTQDTAFRFCNIYKHDTSGALINQYIYKPSTHDTLFEVTLLKNIRDTIRCFGNMQVTGVKNYFYVGYFNNDMSVHPTSFYEYPHNDSNIIIANCMDTLYGAFYVFATRYRLDTSATQAYMTPFVFKLGINNFDSLKLVQVHGSGNDTQSVGTVLDCFVHNGKFKSYIQRRWDSTNYLNNPPTWVAIPKIYNFDTNFVFVKNLMTDPWSFNQLNKYQQYYVVASSTYFSNIKRLSNSYISTSAMFFAYMPNDATRNYNIVDIDLDNDTLKKIYSYPIYDQNDSNAVSQKEAEIVNLLSEDKNHILTLYYEQKVQVNRFLIHITALDSLLNIKWQKFIVMFNEDYRPYTMSRLPNNGVVVAGIHYLPSYTLSKPLIFSLDSTGNLAPVHLQNQNDNTLLSCTVFPNPAAKNINFHFDNQISGSVQILNTEGKLLVSQPIDFPETKIDLQHLSQGIYIYNIISKGEKVLSNRVLKID